MIPIQPAFFASEYASYLYNFVEDKCRCGFKYNGEVKELQRLDKFLLSNSQTPSDHSDNIIYSWLARRANESTKTFSTRNSVYRQLYGYLASENANPLLPIPPAAKEKIHGNGFTPYIFSHDEMNRIFSAIDNEDALGKTFMKCAPLLFRILYATGLRINEALSLRIVGVSFESRCLIVLESKNNDSRLVTVSKSLMCRIEKYLSNLNYDETAPLFLSSSGKHVSKSCAYEWYRWILLRAGIPHCGRGKGPSLHDFRHTFAVHSLQAAIEKGIDPNAYIPLLSVYLGHKNIAATERYLRLTAEAYPYLTAEMDKIMNHIIPEVTDYEER